MTCQPQADGCSLHLILKMGHVLSTTEAVCWYQKYQQSLIAGVVIKNVLINV